MVKQAIMEENISLFLFTQGILHYLLNGKGECTNGCGEQNSVIKYYLYTLFTQMRLTRIVNILYLVQVVGISIFEFTLLQTIFSISQFLMEVPSDILGDYFKKKTITTLGIILLIISQMLLCLNFLFHSNLLFYILCLAFIIEGVGRALISGAADALFLEKIREEGFANIYDKFVENVN